MLVPSIYATMEVIAHGIACKVSTRYRQEQLIAAPASVSSLLPLKGVFCHRKQDENDNGRFPRAISSIRKTYRHSRSCLRIHTHVKGDAVLDVQALGQKLCPGGLVNTATCVRVDSIERWLPAPGAENLAQRYATTPFARFCGFQVHALRGGRATNANTLGVVTLKLWDMIVLGSDADREGEHGE